VALSVLVVTFVTLPARVGCQEMAPAPRPLQVPDSPPPVPLAPPAPAAGDRPLPINLPTALQLAGVRPLDVALASERTRLAAAQLERARVLWLPTILLGADYYRHDGQIQDVAGNVFGTSKSHLLLGAAPTAVFAVTDAIFTPLAARQEVQARQALFQAALNDSLLAVAEAYFNVQQARGELAGAVDAARRAADLVRRTQGLAADLASPVELVRARAEAARRRQAVESARERWRTASAELVRVLRLDAAALVEPLEPPHLRVTLVPTDRPVDDLIPIALTNRPELAAQQALVQATLHRLQQERLRPLIPSVLLRGDSTQPGGTLAGGYFGGGLNDTLKNFSARSDFDFQVLWEFQNLGFGNRARVNERRAENRLAVLELFRTQDRIAAEVAQAYAQVVSAAARVTDAEAGLQDAVESATKNVEQQGQTVTSGRLLILVVRPQEAVAAVQALAQAYADYYGAVTDYSRAQFRLYRALGQPAQSLGLAPPCTPAPATPSVPAPLP
jgi:outer membrane protein TolC